VTATIANDEPARPAVPPSGGSHGDTGNQNPAKVDEVVSYKTSGGAKYYPHADLLGSVHAVSDSAGTTQATWTYDAYGARTQVSGTLNYPFGFTGREHDSDTGLIYARQRYYDPAIGAWLQPDRSQMQSMKDGPNVYQYVGSSPSRFTDPRGTEVWGPHGPEVDLEDSPQAMFGAALLAAGAFVFGGILVDAVLALVTEAALAEAGAAVPVNGCPY
jgi:RHS repeat-associated protein